MSDKASKKASNKAATAATASKEVEKPSREEINSRRAQAIDKHIAELQEQNGGDLRKAERAAAGTIVLGNSLPVLLCGGILMLVVLFLPHSGSVHGYDVLLNSERANAFVTTLPERIYSWLALVGGVLLTFGTVFSRSSLVVWVNWIVSGIGWVYAILAIGMRQSRPPTEPGDGPAIGLILGLVGLLLIFITLSSRLLRRGAVQKEIAARRRVLADADEESRAKQLVLRTGLAPVATEDLSQPEDNRRGRARARREAREAEQAESGAVPTQATNEDTAEAPAPDSASDGEQH
ncbi:MAG TPA: hypothetical protein H9870_11000 [Candidatus Corynebacterium avicola]|uniref:Uncharacterized protein n=1 Tax=Candidatus Corynebacterium avicola TaxID=2838527 RepID=A0A9D1UMT4_9CORY|nr:hypothetical protein [Candidatus Corynebacterium avicola]